MANWLAAVGQADPLAIEAKFQNLAKGEQDIVEQKQRIDQAAAMNPMLLQKAEMENNKQAIALREAEHAEEMGNKYVGMDMVLGDTKQSPKTTSRVFDYYKKNGLVEYVPGADGKDTPVIKMKNVQYGIKMMEQDKVFQQQAITDRLSDVDNEIANLTAQQAELQGKKGKNTAQQAQQIDMQLKALNAHKSSLLTQSANLSGKGIEFAEKKMQDETARRGQDLNYRANMARVGIEGEKMRRDELDKAESQVRQLEGVKQRLLGGGKGDQLLNAVFGDGSASQLGLGDKATINDAVKQIDAEIDNVYSRHKSLGTRKKASQASAWQEWKLKNGYK